MSLLQPRRYRVQGRSCPNSSSCLSAIFAGTAKLSFPLIKWPSDWWEQGRVLVRYGSGGPLRFPDCAEFSVRSRRGLGTSPGTVCSGLYVRDIVVRKFYNSRSGRSNRNPVRSCQAKLGPELVPRCPGKRIRKHFLKQCFIRSCRSDSAVASHIGAVAPVARDWVGMIVAEMDRANKLRPEQDKKTCNRDRPEDSPADVDRPEAKQPVRIL